MHGIIPVLDASMILFSPIFQRPIRAMHHLSSSGFDAIAIVGSSALCVLSLQPTFVENEGGKCFLAPTNHLRGASSNICFRSRSLVLRSSTLQAVRPC